MTDLEVMENEEIAKLIAKRDKHWMDIIKKQQCSKCNAQQIIEI